MGILKKILLVAKSLKRDVLVLWFALRHPDTPFIAKAIAFLTVAYALSPIDLIPDFIPVLGYLDDLLLLPLLIALALRLIPADILESCKQEAQGLWQEGSPKYWVLALPILLIWLLLAAAAAWALLL